MGEAPRFPVKATTAFSQPIFDAASAKRVCDIVQPTTWDEAGRAAELLAQVFDHALTWADSDDAVPNETARQKFYDAVSRQGRDLLALLGTDREGGHEPLPDGLRWLSREISIPYGYLKDVALASRQQLFIDASEDAAFAALPEAYAAQLRSGSNRAGDDAVAAVVRSAPDVIRTLVALAEFWKTVPVGVPQGQRFKRAFQREVYRGLAVVHVDHLFGKLALGVPDNGSAKEVGRSIRWADAAVSAAFAAVEKLGDAALVPDFRARHSAAEVVDAFKETAAFQFETVEDRLSKAHKLASTDPIYEGWPRTDAKLVPPA